MEISKERIEVMYNEARKVGFRFVISSMDIDDIVQDLVTHVVERYHRFDENRSGDSEILFKYFARKTMKRRITHLMRDQFTAQRRVNSPIHQIPANDNIWGTTLTPGLARTFQMIEEWLANPQSHILTNSERTVLELYVVNQGYITEEDVSDAGFEGKHNLFQQTLTNAKDKAGLLLPSTLAIHGHKGQLSEPEPELSIQTKLRNVPLGEIEEKIIHWLAHNGCDGYKSSRGVVADIMGIDKEDCCRIYASLKRNKRLKRALVAS